MERNRRKRYTVEKVVALLEDDETIASANSAIFPPNDGDVAEEDSGDDDGEFHIDNSSKRQLLTQTETCIRTKSKQTMTFGLEVLLSENMNCD